VKWLGDISQLWLGYKTPLEKIIVLRCTWNPTWRPETDSDWNFATIMSLY